MASRSRGQPMVFKTVSRCKKVAIALASSLRKDATLIAEELEPRMAAVLEEGEAMPDVAHLVDVLGRMVRHESVELEKADFARDKKRTLAAVARLQLNGDRGAALREQVQRVRRELVLMFGAQEVKKMLGFSGRTPRSRDELVRLADRMLAMLPVLRPAKVSGSIVTPAGMVPELRAALVNYEESMGNLRESSEDEALRVAVKHKALLAFNRTYRWVMTLGTVFYKLAGLEDRVPFLRYRGGRPARQSKISGAARGSASKRAD